MLLESEAKLMGREMKVWGIYLMAGSNTLPDQPIRNSMQIRAIVATTTKVEAARLFGVPIGYFNDYAAETANDKELETALDKPGQVFGRWADKNNGPYTPAVIRPHIARKRIPKPERKPYVPPVTFTDEELMAIAGRFAGANDPVGQAIARKANGKENTPDAN